MGNFDYFTYWNGVANGVALLGLTAARACGVCLPAVAVYLVASATVVCILGSWLLAYRMSIAAPFHRRVLRGQLMLHVAPFAVAFVLMAMWTPLVGAPPTPRDVVYGLAGLATLFVAWSLTPVDGTCGLAKVTMLYQTDAPLQMCAVGASIAAAAALLCYTRQ